jgi:ABC-type polysaccharide/polyol phosphate transport system ATPase subunit
MTTALQFDHVSKLYHIGAGRASLREALTRLPRRWLGRKRTNDHDPTEFWAMRDVSFEIGQGEALGIIGPNGAGKTTMLKLLSGITRPTEGRITVNGRIGALIELGAGFHPDLTGRENVYLNATILGLRHKEVDALFDEIVEFSGLRRFIDTPVKRYSSGMYARLGFSVAAHVNADILLVDEVLSVGDTAFQAKCVERMKHMRKQGTTVVFVSHNLMAVGGLCQKGLLMNQGRLEVFGPTEAAIRAYTNVVHAASETELKKNLSEPAAGGGYGVDITSVELIGRAGKVQDVFMMGEPLTIRIAYHAHRRIERPVFAIGLVRSDGLNCCSGTSKLSGTDIEAIEGAGVVEVQFDQVNLIPSVYQVGTLIWDYEMIQPYVFTMNQLFRVDAENPNIDNNYGVFVPNLTWRLK